MGVPNGPADVATFGLSHTTDVSISAGTEVNGITFTAAATNPYTITASPGLGLVISGVGITNNSGITQTFVATGGAENQIVFRNGATAGSLTSFVNNGGTNVTPSGGVTVFYDTSTAANASFTNNDATVTGASGGTTFLVGTSTAANGTFVNNGGAVSGADGGATVFGVNATAANGAFTNNGGAVCGARGGVTEFQGSSTAGSATIINNGGAVGGFPFTHGGSLLFFHNSTAGSATITNNGATTLNATGGITKFFHNSSAGNATIINNPGDTDGPSLTQFFNTSTAANGTFINNAGSFPTLYGGITSFFDSSTAGNGTFINNGSTVGGPGSTRFSGNSTAGNGTFINNGGSASFSGNSSAGNGTFINNGGTFSNAFGGATLFSGFFSTPTAANGIFTNNGGTVSGAGGGLTRFHLSTAGNGTFINNGATVSGAAAGSITFDSSTAANGTFTNNGGTASGAGGGSTQFSFSTAGNGTFTNNGGTFSGASGGLTRFDYSSTAGNAIITNNGGTVSGAGGGSTLFIGSSHLLATDAGAATLIANGGINGGQGGTIEFDGYSKLGTARIEVFGNGSLDISRHNAPGMTIDSIEGDGNVFLGANNLTVGSDNLNTTFACAIQDGGQGGGVGGSLTKIGTGTLDLTGTNTYTGNTNVRRGVLQVDGSITSNTFVRVRGRLAGSGTVYGNVTNNGTVNPGDPSGVPGVLTVVHNYTQAQYVTLMIQIAGTNTGEFSVLNVLGNANLNGLLDPVLLNGFVPTIGDSFTFLNYASFTGELFRIGHPVFDNGMLQWSVIYEANHAILTVEQHTPDSGSTFLLLMLGLLGLVTFRQKLVRGEF